MNRKKEISIGWLVLLAVMILPAGILAATQAGKVTKVRGTAQIFRAGEPVTAVPGVEVREGDRVRTAVDSSLRIELSDGSILNLGEKADMTLDQYVFDSARGERKADMKMALGKILVFTKDLKKLKADSFQVRTPNAVVGVRGTLFVVWVMSDVLTKVTCFENEVSVYNVFNPEEIISLGPNDATDVVRGNPPTSPAGTTPDQRRRTMQGTGQDAGTGDPTGGPASDPPAGPERTPASDTLGDSSDNQDGEPFSGPTVRSPGVQNPDDPVGVTPGNQKMGPGPLPGPPGPPEE